MNRFIYKNVASQTISYFAYNVTTGKAVTGDVANHTVTLALDGGAAGPPSNSPSERHATDAKGVYDLVLTQAETNGNQVELFAESSTANIAIMPVFVVTTPQGRRLLDELILVATLSGSPSTTSYVTDLPGTDDDKYIYRGIIPYDGDAAGEFRAIRDYDGGTFTVTVDEHEGTPASGDIVLLV